MQANTYNEYIVRFGRVCAALDYLLNEFPGITDHDQLQWIEGFEMSTSVDCDEGFTAVSLTRVEDLETMATCIIGQHPPETWDYLIGRGDLRNSY